MILQKFKDVVLSVLPFLIIVLFLHVTWTPLEPSVFQRFIVGILLIVIGLTLFLFGVDRGITVFGQHLGSEIVKTNKLIIVIFAAFILGFVISIAEPGLLVYATQIFTITGIDGIDMTLLIVVSIGIGTLLILGFLRIIYNMSLQWILLGLYAIVFFLAFFTRLEFVIIAFDASGATTGVLAVPFILSLAYGISHLKKDGIQNEEDSFGTIAIVSVGAILFVLVIGIINSNMDFKQTTETIEIEMTFANVFRSSFFDTSFAMVPVLLVFILTQIFKFRFHRRQLIHIIKGMVYVFIGLLLFLFGANYGLIDVGHQIGYAIVDFNNNLLFVISFFIGVFVILSEPAVHVLTQQIEEVTSGYITRKSVLIALSLGVGIAIFVSALRIFIESLSIWHLLLPGYIIALSLMFFVPMLFVGIAFDAGGVATGPMTATFVLAFMQGATSFHPAADMILDGLGTIALVALAPIITLQILGLLFKIRTVKEI